MFAATFELLCRRSKFHKQRRCQTRDGRFTRGCSILAPLPTRCRHFWVAPGTEGKDRPLLGLGGDKESSAFAVYQEQRIAAGFANGTLELRDIVDRLMVDLLDYVALLEAGVGQFAGGVDVGDDNTLGCLGDAQLAGGA